MIRRLILRWQQDRALAKRRAARAVRSQAGKAAAATAVHNRFKRDILIRAVSSMGQGA